MGQVDWSAWRLDHLTWGWIAWIAFFVVWETYTILWHPGEELTAHLRPVFLTHPLLWFLAFGLWVWLGVHFLWPAGERAFARAVSSL